jgi:hypothetical protein
VANLVPTVCPYGCRYFNEGWHAENCPGPPKKPLKPPANPSNITGGGGWKAFFKASRGVFRDEPEYLREREADDLERRREEAEDVRTIYPEKGLTDG